MKIPVYILAGGRSSRFGSDKARAEISGEPLLLRIVKTLTPCAESFTAVADVPDKYADLNVPTIADEHPGLGPMSGLHAALKNLRSPGWLLLVSCDFVTLNCAWVETLLGARDQSRSLAVAFQGERVEPLLALYHLDLLPEVDRCIARCEFSPAKMIRRVTSVLLPLPTDWPTLAHVNTPEDLLRSKSKLDF